MRNLNHFVAHCVALCLVLSATLVSTSAVSAYTKSAVVDRPEELTFPELTFDLPTPSDLRFELANGTPVYAKEDHEFPLINLTIQFKGGEYIEPEDKAGLVAIASDVWRTGGAGDLTAQDLDEKLDFLAARLSTRIGDVTGSVSLNLLSKDLETVLPILMDVLTNPQFQADRFAKAKDDFLQSMKTRNDDTGSIERREWNRLIFGDVYWKNRIATKASVERVTAEDCKAFVTSLVKNGNIVIAVAGDFETAALKSLLEKTIGSLPSMEKPLPDVPQPNHKPEPGVYLVSKEDVNQGRVAIGHLAYREGHPKQFQLVVVNDILGGGGFTARMMKKIRSDEGLTYGAYSRIRFPVTTPGTFSANFQSKSSTCAYATELALGLIREIQVDEVSDEEMSVSKASFIDTFPRRFESAAQTVGLFATDELEGRDADYWVTYRDKISAVTKAEMLDAAKSELHPDDMIVLVVGNIEEIMKGHPDHEASMNDFGPIHIIPLRDPMTLEPITE